MRRWCVGVVCASVVSTVRTQGVRARSGAIACRCCSRIAPIATWRESTALKITPFRADQLPEFKGLLFEQAVDDRPCTIRRWWDGSHLGTNDRRAHAPIRPRGSRCRVVLSLHGRWGHRSVRINQFSLGVLRDRMVATGRIMSIRSMPTWHAYATPRWDTSALRHGTRGVDGPSLHRSTLESERKGVGNSVVARVSNLALLMKHVVPQARTHRSRLAQ
jgi:hypothetical protein